QALRGLRVQLTRAFVERGRRLDADVAGGNAPGHRLELLEQLLERLLVAVLRCAPVLAQRFPVLVPRTRHRPAIWELRSSAPLRSSLNGSPSSFLGRGT